MTCLLYLLLLLSPLSSLLFGSVSAKVFVSIDCGSSLSSYTDKHSIEWVGDNLYIQNGETHNVTAPTIPGGWDVSHVMSTLRVFTTRKKNCYSIKADKGERVFVRASFFYGNYDKKSSPPTFNLHVDGNHWARVTTAIDSLFYYEAVYTVKGNTVSICLAQTQPGQLPFISSLEIRSLDAGVYSHIDPEYPLFFGQRLGFGANNITRYPDDAYDRIWLPSIVGNKSTKVTSKSRFIAVDGAEDNPPRSVLRTAITPLKPSEPLSLSSDFSSIQQPLYFNTYFSEVSKLNKTQKRSFQVYVNNIKTVNKTITPPYGGALELRITNVTALKNTSIILKRTSKSTLPPLINAIEVFIVGGKQTEGTNSSDVITLAVLQKSFIQLQDWRGDPCLPSPYTWDWVGCSSDLDNPRITAL
ncbi:Malectin-like carbohydrate-binding domain [Macleaya cordata]|uniref:Malectin-like carbohydrate-binding domain n=1 Tax=Macleaya cordata TaxID=56857 RepID=A0A200PZD7_MACCD|nr:Malectin-like carbohydrate-binding domain [Macleaya cordata]